VTLKGGRICHSVLPFFVAVVEKPATLPRRLFENYCLRVRDFCSKTFVSGPEFMFLFEKFWATDYFFCSKNNVFGQELMLLFENLCFWPRFYEDNNCKF
jgi:hypothetical protein